MLVFFDLCSCELVLCRESTSVLSFFSWGIWGCFWDYGAIFGLLLYWQFCVFFFLAVLVVLQVYL